MKRSRLLPGVLAAVALATGCEAQTRYKILRTVFDGVPPPATPRPAEATAVAGTGGRLALAATPSPSSAHKPFAENGCASCHDAANANSVGAIPALCYKCHEEAKFTGGESLHSPVDDGDCLACHEPHRSSNVRLLRMPVPDLCFDCHKAEPHEKGPPAEPDCVRCHNPHRSERSFLLR